MDPSPLPSDQSFKIHDIEHLDSVCLEKLILPATVEVRRVTVRIFPHVLRLNLSAFGSPPLPTSPLTFRNLASYI